MVDFEHPQARRIGAIGVGVEPGAEHDELARPSRDRRRQRILGKARAHRNE
jgi:hypothetical protein